MNRRKFIKFSFLSLLATMFGRTARGEQGVQYSDLIEAEPPRHLNLKTMPSSIILDKNHPPPLTEMGKSYWNTTQKGFNNGIFPLREKEFIGKTQQFGN